MHISEGVLSGPIIGAGALLTLAGTAIGLRSVNYDRIMTVAMLAAVFFVATLVHVPIGPANAHLVLGGLLGLLLGWAAFPAILVGLLLQAVMFQYGGLAVLGVNCANMAIPAVICHYLFRSALQSTPSRRSLAAFAAGSLYILLTGVLTAASLAFTDEGFTTAAKLILMAHAPIMIIEGLLCSAVVSFLGKVQPELLQLSAEGTA